MSKESPKHVFPWATLALLAALLVVAPFAMQFTPFAGIYMHGVYHAPHETDPHSLQRARLVAFGLGATVLAALELGVVIYRRAGRPSVFGGFAAWFACAVLGWRSMPYWATGVYAACAKRVPWTDLDPKALIPMTWIGEIWRLGVLLLYPAAVLATAAGIMSSIAFYHQGAGARAIIPGACAAIGLLFLAFFSPGNTSWLAD